MPVGSDPRPGSEIAGYRLEELLGRGGMGAVYRAEDVRLGRKVAVKVLASELAENERFRERFLRESQLAASLDHPHIVPIYGAGEADGQLFLAMRYVEGYDLRHLLAREAPLAPERTVRLMEQVADALDAAHDRGLIHRDVKPGNILIAGRAGREHCYLADFGLTKQTSSMSGLTGTGELVGTVEYVSPEQIRGEHVDRRADVYSLACVLFECLAGEPPFARESEVATLWAHVNDAPPSLSEAQPELGRQIDGVLARALAKAPDDRPPTAGELLTSARTALVPTAAAAPPPRRRRMPRVRRLRGRLLLVVAALAAVLVAAAATALLLRDDPAPVTVPPNSVAIVDPEENRVIGTITVGTRPGPIAFGAGSIWVGNLDDRTVTRIDPTRRTVLRGAITLDNRTPTGLAFGFGAVWIAHGLLGQLSKIDPQFNEVSPAVDVGRPGFGSPNGAVAVDGTSVWAVFGDGTLARIDPASGQVAESTLAGSLPAGVVAAESIWVSNSGDATVRRYNPATFTDAPLRPFSVGRRPTGIAANERAVWVANTADDTVNRIDPDSGATVPITVGDGPTAVAVGEGAVWVVNTAAGTLSRIDPDTNEVERTIVVGHAPSGLVLADGLLWVTVQAR